MIYFVTDRRDLSKEAWLSCIIRRMQEGVDFIIIRDKGHQDPELVRQLMAYKKAHKALKTKIVVHSNLTLAEAVDADGVHLPYGLWTYYQKEERERLELWMKDKIVGLSTHQEEEIRLADGKVNYMFLSPVFHPSCKDIEGRGIAWFKALSKKVRTPLVALGGITTENVDLLYKEDIYDIAVMSYLMLESNPLDKLRRNNKC